jgi:hypothetical protein
MKFHSIKQGLGDIKQSPTVLASISLKYHDECAVKTHKPNPKPPNTEKKFIHIKPHTMGN